MKKQSRPFSRPPVRSRLSRTIIRALLLGSLAPCHAQVAQTYTEAGRSGDIASWRTPEFLRNWGLSTIGAEYAYARGLDGGTVRLGIFDAGVALGHPEFAGKHHAGITGADLLADGRSCNNSSILNGAGACFFANGGEPVIDRDNLGAYYVHHGTHVGGIMAAGRNGQGMHGVTFGAALISARTDSNGDEERNFRVLPKNATVEAMLAQMQSMGVRAVNLSFGRDTQAGSVAQLDNAYRNRPALANDIMPYANAASRYGMLQVWAAGNENGLYASVEPSLPRWRPELEKHWLSVVNLNRNGVLDGSSSICGASRDWCVTAPGTLVNSSIVDGTINIDLVRNANGNVNGFKVRDQRPDYRYADETGTSMAAPHVTGALGLLMQRFPYLDNAQIRDVLLTTATDLGAPGVDEIYGWGLLNLRRAIDGPGQMRVDSEVIMEHRAGGIQTWQGAAWDDWRNDISGPGRLSKAGRGWLRLSGSNSFAGLTVSQGVLELDGNNALSSDVRVNGGMLLLNGTLRDTALTISGGHAGIEGQVAGGLTRVMAGGHLSGSGTLADTVVAGHIRPVNANGALRVTGDYTQASGSVFEFTPVPRRPADRLQVSGRADLQGGTLRMSGQSTLGQRYTVLQAGNGVSGRFASIEAGNISPFLRLDAGYHADQVDLDTRRGMPLASAAASGNQREAGTSVDRMEDAQPLLQHLTQLFPQQLRSALDRLSGDGIASVVTVLAEDSHHVRDAALRHAGAGYHPGHQPVHRSGGMARAGTTAWAEVAGNQGMLRADGNAGDVNYSGSKLLLGIDHQFDAGMRMGALVAAGRTAISHAADETLADGAQFDAWLGQVWGNVGVRAGVAWSRYDLDGQRTVVIPGVQNRLKAHSQTHSRQVFVESGYRWQQGAWHWEPYVQVARISLRAGRFAESGGIAALSGKVRDSHINLGTLGLRLNLDLRGQSLDHDWLGWQSAISYRRAGGELTPVARMTWNGGSSFTVAGVPMARQALLLESTVSGRIGKQGWLSAGYTGSQAGTSSEHGVFVRYRHSF